MLQIYVGIYIFNVNMAVWLGFRLGYSSNNVMSTLAVYNIANAMHISCMLYSLLTFKFESFSLDTNMLITYI